MSFLLNEKLISNKPNRNFVKLQNPFLEARFKAKLQISGSKDAKSKPLSIISFRAYVLQFLIAVNIKISSTASIFLYFSKLDFTFLEKLF